jgi:hypothetical protein
MAIFGVQIGIIFSSLVVDPLPDKSVTFVSSGQNHQLKLDWLFSRIDISNLLYKSKFQ